MTELVLLASFFSRPEALIAQGALQAEGIEAFMPDFHVMSSEFDPSWSGAGWRLLVEQRDLARAEKFLRDAQNL